MQLVTAGKRFTQSILLAASLAFAVQAKSADLFLPVTGDLIGTVLDNTGVPQMGATVQVFNKYQRALAKTMTTRDGRFAFADLPADVYSVRVSLSSFLPVARDKILIKAGLDSVLEIHLATLFSNVEVTYVAPTGGMSEDWKWVLRSSPATRPITRFLPDGAPDQTGARPRIFSETHAMLSISGGDGLIDTEQASADLGTNFALSTNILGKNQVQFAGGFGPSTELGPAAIALCAIYSRTDTGSFTSPPEVTLTMGQIGGIGPQSGAGQTLGGLESSIPVLRTMSLSTYQAADPTDSIHLEYGMTGESVDYVQHANRISPFARVTVDFGNDGSIIAAYSDGGRPDELTAHRRGYEQADMDSTDADLSGAVGNLARMPQTSEQNGRLELQRTQNYETGYRKSAGSRTYAVSAFYEAVSNGRLNVTGDLSSLNSEDLLSQAVSTLSTYNIGRYDRIGYIASVNQRMDENLDLSFAYGRMDGFTANDTQGGNLLAEKQRNLASLEMKGKVPRSGTRLSANYGWMDAKTAMPYHAFTTQSIGIAPGLNIMIRQPLPSFLGIPGRLELTADLRNLLAQGYTPLTGTAGGVLIVEAPRAVRGGLNFIF